MANHIDIHDPKYRNYAAETLRWHKDGGAEANINSAMRDFLLTGLARTDEIEEENSPSDDSRRAVDLTGLDTFIKFRRRIGGLLGFLASSVLLLTTILVSACDDGGPLPPGAPNHDDTSTNEMIPTPTTETTEASADMRELGQGTDLPDYEKAWHGTFVSVSAGYERSCAVRDDGTVSCWGGYLESPPRGPFGSISVGGGYEHPPPVCTTKDCPTLVPPPPGVHACGVRTDGSIACWGDDTVGQASPPRGSFSSISAGKANTCGVKDNGSIACWGQNAWAHGGSGFVSVSVGLDHACGMKDDGSIACFGRDADGAASPPAGIFASVSSGYFHTCGLRDGSSVTCWGDNSAGQASPPEGPFTSVTSGYGHSCGVRNNGSVDCWGDNNAGQASPPEGAFSEVDAGYLHTCGLRRNGSVVCWGSRPAGFPDASGSPIHTKTQVTTPTPVPTATSPS